VRTVKSVIAREVFAKAPEVKKQLWGGEFWGNGFFVNTVGQQQPLPHLHLTFFKLTTTELSIKLVRYHLQAGGLMSRVASKAIGPLVTLVD